MLKAYQRIVCFLFLFFPVLLFAQVQVYFSPKGGFSKAVEANVGQAHNTLDVALYHLAPKQGRNDSIFLKAIKSAALRGVKVRLLLESVSDFIKLDHKEVIGLLRELRGVDITVRTTERTMHEKMAIIDGDKSHYILINGSGNWSPHADYVYNEDTLVMKNEDKLLEKFKDEFELLWKISKPMSE